MDQKFEDEQKEIVLRINTIKEKLAKSTGRKGKWNKYLGDVTNKVVIHYLTKYVPDSCLVVGPAVYIEGVGNEFDVLVVDYNVEPIEFSSAYPRDSVRLAIEVKERGFFYKKEKADQLIKEARDYVLENLEGIPFLYITLHESERIMEATRRVYGPNAFFLSTGTGSHLRIVPQEWNRFVETVQEILG
jgi:hypothetical protein